MTNPNIDDDALTPEQLELFAQDRERWARISGGGHLDDWRALAPGLLLRRAMAMKTADTNKPEGRRYNKAMSALLERDGLHTMPKGAVSDLLWLYDSPERITILDEHLATMTAGERSRINSPVTAKQIVNRVVKSRGEPEDKKPRKRSPVAELTEQVLEKTRQVEHLNEKLAAAETQEPAFNFRGKMEDVGERIISSISKPQLRKLIDILTASFKTKSRKVTR
jgi:phage shock protein A